MCNDDDYDFWFDLEEKFRMPKSQLRKIITHKEFVEQKMRFNREPWGSKAHNGQYFILCEMLRKLVAAKYEGFGPEVMSRYIYSRTSDVKDEILDKMLDPETNEFEFSPEGKEMHEYQEMFAKMNAKWGK